jgi:hypothetical protein
MTTDAAVRGITGVPRTLRRQWLTARVTTAPR